MIVVENERMSRDVQRETDALHSRLRDIAQAVINDDQNFANLVEERLNGNNGSCSPRSRSPLRKQLNGSRPGSRTGSPFADATFSAVQAALNKRHLQIHDLRTKLDNARESNSNLKRQLDEADNDKRKLEQITNDLRLQLENIKRSADETVRERDHSKQQLETTNYEKTNLEKVRQVFAVKNYDFARLNFSTLTKF